LIFILNIEDKVQLKKMLEQYYNKETRTLTLPHDFNEELCDLPLNIKVIVFKEDYNKYQPSQFNKPVGHQECEDINCPRNLPNSITHLTFGSDFDQQVDYLPNSITHLTFGENFNQPVGHQGCEDINCPRNLPNSITHLKFGRDFNQSVNNLPNSITHLTFGRFFNQPVDYLPNSITHLTFGKKFNQKVDILPLFLQQIKINSNNKTQILSITKKIPFGCKILNKNDEEVFLQ
jgi:hypothetical protein